ncbi:hypothetical protein GCM10020220_064240 [Nonomuraea rubra]
MVLADRSVAGSLACGRLRPQLRWSNRDDAVELRVPLAAVLGAAPASGAAVDHDGGLAVRVAADLVVDLVSVADVEQARLVRLDGRVQGSHTPRSCRIPWSDQAVDHS